MTDFGVSEHVPPGRVAGLQFAATLLCGSCALFAEHGHKYAKGRCDWPTVDGQMVPIESVFREPASRAQYWHRSVERDEYTEWQCAAWEIWWYLDYGKPHQEGERHGQVR